MSKLRVHELARELNIESKIILTKLKALGAKVLTHQSTLTDQQVADVRGAFGTVAAAPAPQAAASSTDANGKPRVVIRRRAAPTDVGAEGAAAAMPEPTPAEAPAAQTRTAMTMPVAETEAPAKPEIVQPPRPTVTPSVVTVKSPERPAAPLAAAATAQPTKSPMPASSSATVTSRPAASATSTVTRAPALPQTGRGGAAAREEAAEQPMSRREEARGVTETHGGFAAPEAGATTADLGERSERSEPASVAARGVSASGAAAATAVAEPAAEVVAEVTAPVPGRRRELPAGATIVRRATPEEVEKLESANKSRQAGRKEDHRGTRVTGLGLLGNRISADDGLPKQQTAATVAEEDWGGRRGGVAGRDKKEIKDDAEELARKKAAAKAKRSNTAFNARALLQQVDELTTEEEVVPAPGADAQLRTVYTPQAPRTRRDIKRRKDLKKTMITTPRAAYRVINMGESITVGELSKQLAVKAADLIKKLMAQGVMATINQGLDLDTAALLASEYHFEVKSSLETVEDIIKKDATVAGDMETRPPIVTIMGHVDHGKTSLLDAIRSADVASGEAGGITQHIGAYSVVHNGQKIAFLDTPGHEAFSAMRARGAKVTDIVVLVVAADDGVMPQTIEAINHAKAANVPLIVAVNKIDKPNTNLDRVYTELTEHGIQAEEWGGEVQFIKTSALKRQGIDELLEAIQLQAEVLDLKADPKGMAEGAVIEAHLDKGRGPVATIIVQNGTLRAGDFIVAGFEYGRVRAMVDYRGQTVAAAEPADPVEIIGLSGVPRAGDKFNVVVDEKTAREAAAWRMEQWRKAQSVKSSAQSLADLLAKVQSNEIPEVPVIIKGDTQGSVEAISESIVKLSTEKVKNRVVHAAVGGVTESDITLAEASGAVLIAFNVRAPRALEDKAERSGVVIRYFSIIYEIVDALKSIMVGKLPPIVSEVVLGHAEVRKPISVPKIGTIGGSAVLDGKITRSSYCRLLRDNIVIYTGKLGSLRRFKDDVKEVVQGYECGIGIDGYNDLKEGDVIEAFVLEESAATL